MDYKRVLEHLDKFHYIFNKGVEINPIPANKVVCVYLMNMEFEFLVESTTLADLGREKLIARKWILQEDLDKLMEENIS